MKPNLTQRIDEIFALWQRGLCPGGHVMVRKDGEVIYDRCFGYACIELGVKINKDSVFHVASVSKQITVMSLLLLQEDGLVNIDDDVRKYLPELISFSEPVTLRNMMNNVSGIRDQWELLNMRGNRGDDTITQADCISLIRRQTALNFAPKDKYMYSNSNFTLISEIVERISGMSLNDFATKRIFKPLGMDSTCIKDAYWKMIPNKVYSYADSGSSYAYHPLNFSAYGATSVNSTPQDYLKLIDNYINPTVCSKETIEIMQTVPVLNDSTKDIYGGGLMIGNYKGHPYFNHTGVDAGYRAEMLRFPEDNLDIVMMANSPAIIPNIATRLIANIILELEPSADPAEQFYRETYDESSATGWYFSNIPTLFLAEVYKKDDKLMLAQGKEHPHLVHKGGNKFSIGELNDAFYVGENGAYKMGANLFKLSRISFEPQAKDYAAKHAGCYHSFELDTNYNIINDDGLLYLQTIRFGKRPLFKLAENSFVFAADAFTGIIEFTDGGFVLNANRSQGVKFSKAPK